MRNNYSSSRAVSVLSVKMLAGTVLIAGALTMASKPAAATPSTLGFYPSTDVYGKGVFHLDVDTYGDGLKTDAFVTTGLTYGFGSERDTLFGRTEVGFDYVISSGGVSPNQFGAGVGERLLGNIKTQLYSNEEKGVRLVAGAWGLGSKQIAAPNVAYLLASKTFSFGRIHLGVARSLANEATVATPAGNSDRTNLHVAYDKYFLNDKLQFCADYYSGKSAYSGFQPTLYYFVNDKADFGLGLMRFNDSSIGPSRNQIYACFDYNFGGPSTAAAPSADPATPPVN